MADCIRCGWSSIDSFFGVSRFAAFAPLYSKQVRSLRRPLSNPVGGQRPIRGAASRLDGPALDCSSDHSPSDFSNSDHRIFSDSYLMRKYAIQLMAIVVLGAACFLTSCATQNSTARTSSLGARFVAPNSSAKYDDPPPAEDYWLPPGRAVGQPYHRPR